MALKERIRERVVLLLDQLRESGDKAAQRPAGAAKAADLDVSYASKLTKGQRGIGLTALERICARLGLDVAFFVTELDADPHYTDYMIKGPLRGNAAVEAYVASMLRGGTPIDQALAQHLRHVFRRAPDVSMSAIDAEAITHRRVLDDADPRDPRAFLRSAAARTGVTAADVEAEVSSRSRSLGGATDRRR